MGQSAVRWAGVGRLWCVLAILAAPLQLPLHAVLAHAPDACAVEAAACGTPVVQDAHEALQKPCGTCAALLCTRTLEMASALVLPALEAPVATTPAYHLPHSAESTPLSGARAPPHA